MNTGEVIMAILIFSLIMNIFYIFHLASRKKTEKIGDIEKFRIAIDIFNIWKREIGGVALKGVGQHFENYLWKKLNEKQNPKKTRE